MELKKYLIGDRLTAEVIDDTPPMKRKVTFTSEFHTVSFPDKENPGLVIMKPVATVIFNGEKKELIIGRKIGRKIAKELGTNTDAWKDCTVDLDTEKRGMYHYIIVKAVYGVKAPERLVP